MTILILVQQNSMNFITNIYNQKAIALDTDHTMVIACMSLKLPIKTRKHRYVSTRIDYNKLKDRELCDEYDSTIFLPNNITITTTNIDELYNGWKDNIVNKRLFKKEEKRSKSWITNSTLLLVEEKRRLVARKDFSLEDMQRYRDICKRVKKAVARDRHLHIKSIIDELNTYMKQSNLHGVFSIIKKRLCVPERAPRTPPIKDKNGCVVDNIIKQLHMWVNYFDDLFNPSQAPPLSIGVPIKNGVAETAVPDTSERRKEGGGGGGGKGDTTAGEVEEGGGGGGRGKECRGDGKGEGCVRRQQRCW